MQVFLSPRPLLEAYERFIWNPHTFKKRKSRPLLYTTFINIQDFRWKRLLSLKIFKPNVRDLLVNAVKNVLTGEAPTWPSQLSV